MPRVDPSVIYHKLIVLPEAKLMKQKPQKMNAERLRALNDEADWLLKADFIRETLYLGWLANPVLVKKNGKWRVCIDLNMVCPKDNFPLPSIVQIVDATAGHELLSFMDAYSGYNQIKMHLTDDNKTAFTTSHTIYRYKVIPFGLTDDQ